MVRKFSYTPGILMLMTLFIGFGCNTPRTRTPEPDFTPGALINRVIQENSKLQDFKGSARVTVYVNGRRGRVATRIRFKQPDHLKIQVQGLFMQVMAVLNIKASEVMLYIPQDNVVFEGNLDGSDVVMPGMRVPLADIRTAATGLLDPGKYPEENMTSFRQVDGQHLISFQDPLHPITRTIWIDSAKYVITREEEEHANGVTIIRRFEGYRRQKDIWRPSKINIKRSAEDETLELVYDMQSLNSGLTHADIALKLPRSVRHMPLSDAVFEQ